MEQIRECLKCKTKFVSRNSRSLYCIRHRHNAYFPKEKKCLFCKKIFTTNKKTKQYCDAYCQLEANKPYMQFVTCSHCGKLTKKFPGKKGGNRFETDLE